MKYLLIIVLTLFQFSFAYSQRGGGGGQRGGQSGQNRPLQQNNEKKAIQIINIKEAAGLITYDPETVIKEAKVKKAEDKTLMTQFITDYNKKVIQIKKTNKVKLETTELTSLGQQKVAIERKDLKKILEIDMYINNELYPIKMEVMEAEKELNTKIEASFSEKINKKWLNYLEKQKEANQPKAPKENADRPDNAGGRNNQMR